MKCNSNVVLTSVAHRFLLIPTWDLAVFLFAYFHPIHVLFKLSALELPSYNAPEL